MRNAFDLRELILAKHAQHVVLVHFPIALFMTGVAFDLVALGKRSAQLARAAYLNVSLAAALMVPTFLTGLLAWHFALEGKRIKGLLLFHLLAASGAALLVLVSWWLHRPGRGTEPVLPPRYRVPIELLGVVLVAATAHLGGFLSGVNT